jgi:hypothetical protein
MTAIEMQQIDAYVISFNENQYYNIEEQHKKYIKEIRGVYLFDHNIVSYCCEFTPSYFFFHLYDEVIFTELADWLTDDQREDIATEYENCGGEDKYFHCNGIDKMLDNSYHYGNSGVSYEETDYNDQMEALIEHFKCNRSL